jgi:hypothetical protein
MKKTLFLAAVVICATLLLISCKTDNANNANGGTNSNNSNSGNKGGGTTASGSDVGVPECDAYIKKYEACINDKMPAAARDQAKSSLEVQRKAWRDAIAANPQSKASIGAGCKAADDAAKPGMTQYGCTW